MKGTYRCSFPKMTAVGIVQSMSWIDTCSNPSTISISTNYTFLLATSQRHIYKMKCSYTESCSSLSQSDKELLYSWNCTNRKGLQGENAMDHISKDWAFRTQINFRTEFSWIDSSSGWYFTSFSDLEVNMQLSYLTAHTFLHIFLVQ